MRSIVCLLVLLTMLGSARPALAVVPADGAPWRAEPTTEVQTETRSFYSGGATLTGTLYLPRTGAPVAAMVVTHGAASPLRSSPLYEHLKSMLPALGIAVFVYDRRGSGQSGAKSAGGDFTVLADDAIAAVQNLKTDPRIDPRRIGVWGLSQGGWISVLAASRSRDIALAVSISAPMVTPDVQMMFSSANTLRVNGYAQADIDQMAATRRAVDDYMRGVGSREAAQKLVDSAKTRPWFKYLYMGETVRDRDQSGWRKEIEHDPLTTLVAVKLPMLVIYGATDPVVPVAESVERLRRVSSRLPRMQVVVIAGADHCMQTSMDPKVLLDPNLLDIERPDSADYFAVLASWLTAQGFAKTPPPSI